MIQILRSGTVEEIPWGTDRQLRGAILRDGQRIGEGEVLDTRLSFTRDGDHAHFVIFYSLGKKRPYRLTPILLPLRVVTERISSYFATLESALEAALIRKAPR